MPIYEYKCQKCGHVFEVTQSFNDEPIKTCPKNGCRGKVKKLFSPPAIIFKGSGFYVNDYARGNGNGKRPRSDGDKPDEAKTEARKTCEAASSKAAD